MSEATIIVNGRQLSEPEAMTVRVALSSMNFDCGDDEHGKLMARAYRQNAQKVLRTIVERPVNQTGK